MQLSDESARREHERAEDMRSSIRDAEARAIEISRRLVDLERAIIAASASRSERDRVLAGAVAAAEAASSRVTACESAATRADDGIAAIARELAILATEPRTLADRVARLEDRAADAGAAAATLAGEPRSAPPAVIASEDVAVLSRSDGRMVAVTRGVDQTGMDTLVPDDVASPALRGGCEARTESAAGSVVVRSAAATDELVARLVVAASDTVPDDRSSVRSMGVIGTSCDPSSGEPVAGAAVAERDATNSAAVRNDLGRCSEGQVLLCGCLVCKV